MSEFGDEVDIVALVTVVAACELDDIRVLGSRPEVKNAADVEECQYLSKKNLSEQSVDGYTDKNSVDKDPWGDQVHGVWYSSDEYLWWCPAAIETWWRRRVKFAFDRCFPFVEHGRGRGFCIMTLIM